MSKELPCSMGSGVVSDCGNLAEFAVWITRDDGWSGSVINKCGPCADRLAERFMDDTSRTVHRAPLSSVVTGVAAK